MAFIQIVEFRTDKIDEMRALDAEWAARANAEGATARRGILCGDRDDPGRYFQIVFFDSHEDAETNSNLPVTQEFAQNMMALGNGQPAFHNLDVVEDITY
ncbi:MAG: hypothetical protein WDA60_12570 [Acidimicrobiia bacterium]|jgi:hypothetical protein